MELKVVINVTTPFYTIQITNVIIKNSEYIKANETANESKNQDAQNDIYFASSYFRN